MLITISMSRMHDMKIKRWVARVHRSLCNTEADDVALVDTLDPFVELIDAERDCHGLLTVEGSVLFKICGSHTKKYHHHFGMIVFLEFDSIWSDH